MRHMMRWTFASAVAMAGVMATGCSRNPAENRSPESRVTDNRPTATAPNSMVNEGQRAGAAMREGVGGSMATQDTGNLDSLNRDEAGGAESGAQALHPTEQGTSAALEGEGVAEGTGGSGTGGAGTATGSMAQGARRDAGMGGMDAGPGSTMGGGMDAGLPRTDGGMGRTRGDAGTY